MTQTQLRNEVLEGGETMARLARVEVFASDEVAVVHVMTRTVRRCFLLGDDAVTGKNYDHRKQWIDDQLVHQARHFGIDLLCQAIWPQRSKAATSRRLRNAFTNFGDRTPENHRPGVRMAKKQSRLLRVVRHVIWLR